MGIVGAPPKKGRFWSAKLSPKAYHPKPESLKLLGASVASLGFRV